MAEKKRYKLKEVKTYNTKEWLHRGKMYQTVFIGNQTSWIYGELSIYNILFDEEDWKCTFRLEGHKKEGSSLKQIWKHEEEKEVKKTENVAFYRYGWGNKDKTYWKNGEYELHAFINGQFVGKTDFYVESFPVATPENNPCFDIQAIKFFEEGSKKIAVKDRKYVTQFIAEETRYAVTEFTMRNKLKHSWWCELQFFYYDQHGRLRGDTHQVFQVKNETTVRTFAWGNDAKNIWKAGVYTVEILFMGQRIAVVPFQVGSAWVEGVPEITNSDTPFISQEQSMEVHNEATLEECLEKLDELIGLTSIKKQIREYIEYLKFEKIRQEKGLEASKGIKLHTVLTGNPGTGKTTVAKQLGQIYKAMGLLTSGHVHEVDRSDLVGEYIGQTAPKTRGEIERARGGILFIDEAYSLHRESTKNDYGQEVVEILLKEMSDGPGNLIVIVAGYPDEMNGFINSNPGLKSRFNHFFHFPDYVPEELLEIADLGYNQRGLTVADDAKELLDYQLTKAFRGRDKSFGNARYVMSIVDESKLNMGLRLMKDEGVDDLSKEILSTVTKDDVQRIFLQTQKKQLSFAVDQELLRLGLRELDELVGMDNVKTEIRELVKLVTYYREIGKDVLNQFVMHTVFVGNPGTGKTTVARIFAKIFKALGLIEGGHLVECDRESLVAGYTGQTAIKTAKVIDQAMGGVLFIDEAYALVNGDRDAFGMEAVQTILKRMEDHKSQFIIIAAGYPHNMKEFLQANPGLKSRFEKTIEFKDYGPEALMKIAEFMFEKDNHRMNEKAKGILNDCLIQAFDGRDEHFGNARFVRKIVQQATRDHDLRLADMNSADRTIEMIETITPEDFKNLPQPEAGGGSPSIGFQQGDS